MSLPLVLAGYVFQHGTETAIENVIVTVRNLNTGEAHNGAEGAFPELKTNSSGEWQVNLANYTEDYATGDIIEITCKHNDKRDKINYTIGESADYIVLTPLSQNVYDYEQSLKESGDKINIYSISETIDTDYESINSSSTTEKDIDNDIYAYIQIENDEITNETQGQVTHGNAKGFFAIRYNVEKNNKLTKNNDAWIVIDKPVRRYLNNEPHHDEARLVRI